MQRPTHMEPLRAVVERLKMSVEGVTQGDRGYRATCTVHTRDLMILIGAAIKAGPQFLSQMYGVTGIRDGKMEDVP
jgi:hypothetical protein